MARGGDREEGEEMEGRVRVEAVKGEIEGGGLVWVFVFLGVFCGVVGGEGRERGGA